MFAWFAGLNPVAQTLVATLFAWLVTALGAMTGFAAMMTLDVALGQPSCSLRFKNDSASETIPAFIQLK
jgi:dipeptide/tripeptide permease